MINRTRQMFTSFILILCILLLLFASSSTKAHNVDVDTLSISAATHNLYYSEYADAGYYRNTAVQDDDPISGEYYYWYRDDGLQRRANCYGYAFRLFYAPKVFPNDVMIGEKFLSYKQLPGEFASKSAGLDILDPSGSDNIATSIFSMAELSEFYYDTIYNANISAQNRMNYFVQLLRADATKLGYTLQEYTGTAIPDCSAIANKRMIAVVLTNTSYHFYMQHSDNSWSHKDGKSQPRNTCFSHGTPLMNSNIRSHVSEGTYANGQVKFFYLTKKSIIDCGHLDGSPNNATMTSLSASDGAGNNFETAINLTSWASQSRTGYIDYVNDVDCYYATAPRKGSFTFSFSSGNSVIKTVELYSSDGTLLTSKAFTSGSTSFSFPLVTNNTYILKISTSGQTLHQYGYTYTFTVSP